MARGTANNEPVVSQANSKEFDSGYARIYGERKAQRGRWIWDVRQSKLVPADEYVPPSDQMQINMDRHYENLGPEWDGTVITSRRAHKEFMERHHLALADDFKGVWAKQEKEREALRKGDFDHKQRREDIARALYQLRKP